MDSDDLFESYFALVKETEPPAIFHRWALLGVLGAWLGRSAWLPFGSGRIFPNQYIMFIGDPGARKSTAIKRACSLIEILGFDKFAPKKTSKEQYLADLTGETTAPGADPLDFDVLTDGSNVPAESFINADEFNIFMGPANLDFQSLLGDLWDWDSPKPWQYRLKNSKSVSIFQPTINILSGNTPQGFSDCFPPASVGQGFMSRLILIYGERTSKRIPFPPLPDEKLQRVVLEKLVRIRSKIVGEFVCDKQSYDALSLIYTSWPGVEDSRFTHYNARRFTHLLKLVSLHAAARESLQITIADVVRASTVLAYAESQMPKAVGESGQSKTSAAAQKLMQALYAASGPLTIKELWLVVKNDLDRPADLSQIINNLLLGEKLQVMELAGGRGTAYLPRHKAVSRKVLYYDASWLKGKELSE